MFGCTAMARAGATTTTNPICYFATLLLCTSQQSRVDDDCRPELLSGWRGGSHVRTFVRSVHCWLYGRGAGDASTWSQLPVYDRATTAHGQCTTPGLESMIGVYWRCKGVLLSLPSYHPPLTAVIPSSCHTSSCCCHSSKPADSSSSPPTPNGHTHGQPSSHPGAYGGFHGYL